MVEVKVERRRRRVYPYVVSVVVKEGDGLREGCGGRKGIEWLLPCVRV